MHVLGIVSFQTSDFNKFKCYLNRETGSEVSILSKSDCLLPLAHHEKDLAEPKVSCPLLGSRSRKRTVILFQLGLLDSLVMENGSDRSRSERVERRCIAQGC